MRRILSVFLSLIIVLTLLPLTVLSSFAETNGEFQYKVLSDGKTCEIKGYTGSAADLKIPSEIDGYTVTGIGSYILRDMDFVQSIEIPDSVTYIGSFVFENCKSLVSVSLGSGLKTIHNSAFQDCVSLKNLVIPDSVKQIWKYAFKGCKSLIEVSIPENVTFIEEGVFSECSSLSTVNVSEANQEYISEDGILFNREKTLIKLYPAGKSGSSYTIPDSVTSVGGGTFYGCQSLENIIIPEGVKKIEDNAFKNCTSLKNIVLPESVTKIGDNTFENCAVLESINIPDGVTEIGSRAFSNCASIKSITVPDGVTYIDSYVFSYCNSLEKVILPEYLTGISSLAFEGCKSIKEITIPKGVKSISFFTFSGCTSLENVILPDTIEVIDLHAFYCCNSIKSIEFPDSMERIGEDAFNSCKSLEMVKIGSNLKTVGEKAFFGCDMLTQIVIPETVTEIGDKAFGYCNGFSSVQKVKDFTIYGYRGTKAEEYANSNGFKFISFGDVAPADFTEYNKAVAAANALDRNLYQSLAELDTALSVDVSDKIITEQEQVDAQTEAILNAIGSLRYKDAYYDDYNKAVEQANSLDRSLYKDLSAVDSAVSVDVSDKNITEQSVINDRTKAILDAINALEYKDADYLEYNKAVEQANAVDRTQYTDESLAVLDNALAVDVSGKNITEQSVVDAQTQAITDAINGLEIKTVKKISMYRLYNPNSGEHFYTADENERNNLVSVGWKYEGIGWTAPETSDKPVYRLYNQNGGEHHYTLDASERDFLVSLGWKFEDIGWYSADTNGIPLYRQYNPNAFANNHNYTADKSENDWLVSLGWKAEGIGWYGVA